jgi:hypothetical protein
MLEAHQGWAWVGLRNEMVRNGGGIHTVLDDGGKGTLNSRAGHVLFLAPASRRLFLMATKAESTAGGTPAFQHRQ